MPSVAINELIRMYSSGIISRDNLEREISLWKPEEQHRRDRKVFDADGDEYITLYPDQTGTWRVAA